MEKYMDSCDTATMGFQEAIREIKRRGGVNVAEHKEGNRKFITFTGLNGKSYTVVTRSRKVGTWQTSIEYGRPSEENASEDNFWLFVDLENRPPKFYPVPLWWISNNIHEKFQMYLSNHGGHRKYNDKSTHHAVQLDRIEAWEHRWSNMGLRQK